MSSRKSPPPPINSTAAEKGKGRARPPSRTPSRADHDPNTSDDDAPPTSTLRARNVTGTSMLEFPPSPGTPRSGGSDETVRSGGAGGGMGGWKLPGVKGTMGGLASPGRHGPGSPAAWSPNPRASDKDGDERTQRPPVTFRTDPTIKSCLDTLPLESKDEIRRLFGLS